MAEENPNKILKISDHPSLDVGSPGCFDDNGVILGDVIRIENKLYMYYVGSQHVQNVKFFFAFTGLAISLNQGESFQRYSETPILDRTPTGRCIIPFFMISDYLNAGMWSSMTGR